MSSWLKTFQQYLKGFFLFGIIEDVIKQRQQFEELFRLSILGKFIGIPGLFNYYHLRLMPYYMGDLKGWKRRLLRERDFFDQISE